MHITVILYPFSWLYGLVVYARNKAFDWGVLRVKRVRVPVISVGNLTAGGTGKTPLVEYLVSYLLSTRRRVAVVSRGYGRRSTGVVVVSDGKTLLVDALGGGDEPVQIARKFPSACVVVGEKRVRAASMAIAQLGADVVVLDDGFQHRYLHRDLDIVVVDGRKDLALEPLLPAGVRREALSGLRRAQLLAISKVGSLSDARGVASGLARWYEGDVIAYRYRTEGVFRVHDQKPVVPGEIAGKPALAFSGTGDNEGFLREVEKLGCAVTKSIRFGDHHEYTANDLRVLSETMESSGAEFGITTEKDAMRLLACESTTTILLRNRPVYYIRIGVEVMLGEEAMIDWVRRTCTGGID